MPFRASALPTELHDITAMTGLEPATSRLTYEVTVIRHFSGTRILYHTRF